MYNNNVIIFHSDWPIPINSIHRTSNDDGRKVLKYCINVKLSSTTLYSIVSHSHTELRQISHSKALG